MALDLLNKIRAAEESTEEKRAEAQKEGREIIKGVEEACRLNERSVQTKLNAVYQEGIDELRQKAEGEIETLKPKKAQELEQMVQSAEKKLPEAVKLIAERIVNNGHR